MKPKAVRNEHGVLELLITHEGPEVIVNAPKYGLYVISLSSSLFVQAATFYRGKICGLCGDFDLNGQNDFKTIDGYHHNTAHSFAQNFVIPDADCALPHDG